MSNHLPHLNLNAQQRKPPPPPPHSTGDALLSSINQLAKGVKLTVRVCQVCRSPRATGFNYRGLCCDPCKVFFFRNYARIQTLRCERFQQSAQRCSIDSVAGRRGCTSCRMARCLELGMGKKGDRLVTGRRSRRSPEAELLNGTIESSSLNMNFSSTPTQTPASSLMHETVERALSTLTVESENEIEQIQNQNTLESSSMPILIERPLRAQRRQVATDLTITERQAIARIRTLVSELFIDEETLPVVTTATDISECFQIPERYFRSVVRLATRLPIFCELPRGDQLTLLRSFCYDFLTVWFAHLYDRKRKGCVMLADEQATGAIYLPFVELSHQVEDQEAVKVNFQLYDRWSEFIEGDKVVRDLLGALVLWKWPSASCKEEEEASSSSSSRIEIAADKSPEVSKVSSTTLLSQPETVRYRWAVHARLLARYLVHKYRSVSAASRRWAALMRMITTDLGPFKRNERKVALEWERKRMQSAMTSDGQFQPPPPPPLSHLMLEMFELT